MSCAGWHVHRPKSHHLHTWRVTEVYTRTHTNTHTTFSEFAIEWFDALDKSRTITTLQRWKDQKKISLSSIQSAGSHLLTLLWSRIQPTEHIQRFSAYQLHCANHWYGHHKHTYVHLACSFHIENIHLYIIAMYKFRYRATKCIQLSATAHRQGMWTE